MGDWFIGVILLIVLIYCIGVFLITWDDEL
jgi:hypothetical protein